MQPAVLSVAAMHGSTWWLSASCKARHTYAGVCLHSPVLQSSFCTAFKRASPDFQTRFGYGVDPPNQANMAICSNQVGGAFVGWLVGGLIEAGMCVDTLAKKLGIPADFIPHHKLCFVALAVCVGRPAL
jgi:hypothetical protein